MQNRLSRRAVLLLVLGILWLLAAACGGPTESRPSPTATSTVTPGLKAPDGESPAVGICADPPAGGVVTLTINVDVPDPRCAKILRTQRVRVANGTGEAVRVRLARFDVTLAPGEGETFEAPLETYLAPGVHVVTTSRYGGSGPELWLIGD